MQVAIDIGSVVLVLSLCTRFLMSVVVGTDICTGSNRHTLVQKLFDCGESTVFSVKFILASCFLGQKKILIKTNKQTKNKTKIIKFVMFHISYLPCSK